MRRLRAVGRCHRGRSAILGSSRCERTLRQARFLAHRLIWADETGLSVLLVKIEHGVLLESELRELDDAGAVSEPWLDHAYEAGAA